MSNINLVTFLDSVQRTIIGELTGEDDTFFVVQNPVVVNIVPQLGMNNQPTGQMALQLLPVYFKEFQGEKKNPAILKYRKDSIVQISFEGGFDFRLYAQYENIFRPQSVLAPSKPQGEEAPVIKLFDD